MKNSFMVLLFMTGFVYAEKLTLHTFPDRDVTVQEVHELLTEELKTKDVCSRVDDLKQQGYTNITFRIVCILHNLQAYYSDDKDVSAEHVWWWNDLQCLMYNYCTETDENKKRRILEQDFYRAAQQFVPIYHNMRIKKAKEARDRK